MCACVFVCDATLTHTSHSIDPLMAPVLQSAYTRGSVKMFWHVYGLVTG